MAGRAVRPIGTLDDRLIRTITQTEGLHLIRQTERRYALLQLVLHLRCVCYFRMIQPMKHVGNQKLINSD